MQELTNREFEIMNYVAQGYKINFIAKKLYLAEETILNYLQKIYDKFEIEPKSKTYNRKTRSIYLFKKYKDLKTLNNLNLIKQKLIENIDLSMNYFISIE